MVQMSQALVKIAAVWLLGLMLAVAGAIVSINLVNASIAGPQQPVREYLSALQKGDGEKALGLLRASVPQSNPAMLDGTALQTAAARISDVKLGAAEERGRLVDQGQVPRVAAVQPTDELTVGLVGRPLGAQAARQLGISRQALYRRMEKHGL